MDWSKFADFGNKAQNIIALGKDAFGDKSESTDIEKSLFGNKEKEEIAALELQLSEEKKKQQNTLMYVIGALVLLMFTGILKIGK
jgi:hypothetical protein